MSDWKYPKKEDIELVDDVLHIWFESDDFGNRYIVLKVKDIKEILKKKN